MSEHSTLAGQRFFGRIGRGTRWLYAVVFVLALVVAGPIVSLFLVASASSGETWSHLVANVLPVSVWETALLMAGVGLLTVAIGASSAWLVTMYRFPGRKMFVWMSVIPLAMPTYLTAFAYTDLLDYSGPLQTGLRAIFGWTSLRDYWFPEIRSIPGAIFVISSVLYPYVYLTARVSFVSQSICAIEVARTLGRSHWGVFWNVGLPLARPALVAGATLALMETLNDIGAVEYFGVRTLTLSVYDTWLERGSLPGAAQIACVMLLLVVALIWIERVSRRRQQYYQTTGRYRDLPAIRLKGFWAFAVVVACALPILIGFVLPAAVLVKNSWVHWDTAIDAGYFRQALYSVSYSAAAAGLAVVIAVVLSYARRILPDRTIAALVRVCSLGYAVPGTVLAIGILVFFGALDRLIGEAFEGLFQVSTGLVLSGTSVAIVFAYVVRFMAISYGALESGFAKVSPNLDDVARSLGRTSGAVLREIHLPMLKAAIGSAALLVFVDSMKELPATLLLRSIGVETLATHVYTLASLDMFEEGAPAALTIVLIGLIPVILLSKVVSNARPGAGRRKRMAGR